MKKIAILILTLSLYNSFSQSKCGIIEYDFSIDSMVNIMEKKGISKPLLFMKNVNNAAEEIKLQLMFKNQTAVFKNINNMRPDNINKTYFNLAKMLACSNPLYYKKDSVQKKVSQNGKAYVVNGKIAPSNWIITKESKKIIGYNCIKATSKRTIKGKNLITTAWFAPSIKIPYGPNGYGGLPGVILELNLNATLYKATKIKFLKQVSIEPIGQGKQISEEEYSKLNTEQLNKFKEAIK
ncbi:GLPGLI family protein [Cellulophaga sp. RHA_52]|uniref:GLPGLI family protein n=1 Tax=Cellulophaga sp. RHA_52 TaxID=1250036 RepID=UPI00119B3249|nr:GLPGLI family protein [Cellulophaga sp. RHA_52]TVZ07888.1 GLPGLI family protein [Cellulophaga sp. RHA_52]